MDKETKEAILRIEENLQGIINLIKFHLKTNYLEKLYEDDMLPQEILQNQLIALPFLNKEDKKHFESLKSKNPKGRKIDTVIHNQEVIIDLIEKQKSSAHPSEPKKDQ